MSKPLGRASVGIAAAFLLTLSLTAQKGTPEPRVGLAFNPPKGWVELPGGGDRHATVRLFAAPRALAGKDEGTHTPILRVMFFAKGGDASKDEVDGLPRTTPFRGLEDFAARGLGVKDAKKEAAKLGGVEGQRVTGTVGDRTLIGATVAVDGGEAAICVEVLTNQFEKLKKDIDGALTTLAPVARVAGARLDAPWTTDADWGKKDAAARLAARKKWSDEVVAAAAKAPEAPFKVSKSKYWTVLSAADPGFTKKAVAAAEACRGWLQTKLPELAKDAPMPAVLRIFDSPDHYRAYLTTVVDQREYDQHKRELYFVNDPDNGGSSGYGQLFRAVVWHAIDDIDEGALPALPRWLDNGLWEFMRSTRCDGKKVDFEASDVEKGRMVWYGQNSQELPATWHLIQEKVQASPTDGSTEKDWGYTPDCARLLRWFLLHDGQKAFEKPTLLADYVKALGASMLKLGRDPTADVAPIGLGNDQVKSLNTKHYKWRDDLLLQINATALGITEAQWRTANDKWLEFNKTFK